MKRHKWTFNNPDALNLAALRAAMPGTREVLCKIFVQRGLTTFQSAKEFFNPDITSIPDPMAMKDMEAAVDRIIIAMKERQRILLYGDYDVDGTSAVALMYRYLSKIYDREHIDFYIPDRNLEGYGLSKTGIRYALEQKINLIITLDCGISSTELINEASDRVDFIICDHHIPGNTTPNAVAILNPKQAECPYPFKELCGCGIAFKLVSAINKKLANPDEYFLEYLDLVAVATGADIVAMKGENRVLCYHGLRKLNTNPCIGIEALIKVAGAGHYDNYKSVFQLAPRINAAGRMNHGSIAVQLLIENDPGKAMDFAKILDTFNEDRKRQHLEITNEAMDIILEKGIQRKTIVVHKEGWHKGVLGIVASKLQEIHYKPAIVLTTHNGTITGSARSIKDFNIYEALRSCSRHLSQFGGHTAAAGLTMRPEELDAFSEKFEQTVGEKLSEDCLASELVIDAELNFCDIDFKLFNTLKRMEPFGPDNPTPIFITKNAVPTEYTSLVKEKHIRFVFRHEHLIISGIGFNMAEKFCAITPGVPIDIVYSIKENWWNGQCTLQLHILDFANSID